MKRVFCSALFTAVLAGGAWLAQPAMLSLFAAIQQAPAPGAPAPQAGRGGFGGPIELGPDDKPAFPDPPAGFNVKRDNIPRGELTHVQYDSTTLGTRRRIRVYTPPGYSPSRKYPVLYLLHGLGWNDLEWTEVRHAEVVIDNLLADGEIRPMIMVFPNGDSSMTVAQIEAAGGGPWMGRGMGGPGPGAGAGSRGGGADAAAAGRGVGTGAGAPSRSSAAAGGGRTGAGDTRGGAGAIAMHNWLTPFEHDLIKDIVPFVESRYSAYSDPDHRALAGLSMGGGQALNIGLVHPETFAYVGGFSSAPDTKAPPDLVPDPAVPRRLRLIWLACGNKDGLIRISQGVHAYLKEKGVPHVWHVDGNAHDTIEWQNNLYLFSQRIFR